MIRSRKGKSRGREKMEGKSMKVEVRGEIKFIMALWAVKGIAVSGKGPNRPRIKQQCR